MEAPLSRPFVHRRKIGASPMSTLESVYTCRKRNTVRSQSGQRRGAPANQYLHEVVEEARRPLQGSSSSLEVGWLRKPERRGTKAHEECGERGHHGAGQDVVTKL